MTPEVLERENAERKDAESSVNELKRQFTSIKERCASAEVEIDQYRDEAKSLRRGLLLLPSPTLPS